MTGQVNGSTPAGPIHFPFSPRSSTAVTPDSPSQKREAKNPHVASPSKKVCKQLFTEPSDGRRHLPWEDDPSSMCSSSAFTVAYVAKIRFPLPDTSGFEQVESRKRLSLPMPQEDGFCDAQEEKTTRQSFPLSVSKQPPPAPRKKSIVSAQRMVKNKPFIEARKHFEILATTAGAQTEKLSSEGQYKEVFLRENRVIKVYKQKHDESSLEEWTQNAMEQYRWCLSRELPCATIYNDPVSDGYFETEYVPFSVQDKIGQIMANSQLKENFLSMLTHFFASAIQCRVSLDLQFANFRVREDGTLCLVDLRESQSDQDEAYADVGSGLKKTGCTDKTTWHHQFPEVADEIIARLKVLLGSQHLFFKSIE